MSHSFEEAQTAFTKYPYYTVPQIEALESADHDQRAILAARIATAVGDEAALRTILGIDPDEFASFYPDMKPKELSTDQTITSFISQFASEKAAETPEIDEILAAPAIDYASLLATEEGEAFSTDTDGNNDATDDAIAAFLNAVPPRTPAAPKRPAAPEPAPPRSVGTTPENDQNDESLSETLLKVMIKNRNYSKALEIITDISLKNPKKSIYFADQKRFLEKLIRIQQKSES